MNILTRLLEVDYHMAKSDAKRGLILETPAKPEFLPAIVSTLTAGRLLAVDRLTSESRIRSGIFKSSENLDVYIPDIYRAARELSESKNWGNIFPDIDSCIKYLRYAAELNDLNPAIVISQDQWFELCMNSGADHSVEEYLGSKVFFAPIPHAMVFSRPDLVGLLTQFSGSYASILLHNVRMGCAFVI